MEREELAARMRQKLIIGDAQEARWLAGVATSQVAIAQETMLAGDLDDAASAMRRAAVAMRMVAETMANIIRNAN